MFVSRKRHRSGSYSVVVLEKDSRTRENRTIRIIGTSSDERELQEMERQAYEYIDSHRGPLLPMDYHDSFEDGLEKFLSGISNSHIQVIGPELIYGRLYDRIGYGELNNDMFRHLVICRLFNPGSKLRTVEYLRRYLNKDYDVEAIYKFLDNLCYRKDKDCRRDKTGKPVKPQGEDIKTQVERISYAWTKKRFGDSISVVFYDMTTLYFEAAQEDDLRKTGFSKDGKHACPQIFLGLLVGPGGNPIGYEIYEGNIHEGKTLIPVVEALAGKHGFDHPIVVADAGLLSKTNIEELTKNGYEYIIGARVKNESEDIKQSIIGMELQYGDIRVIDKEGGVRLIVSKSEKRAKKDAHARKKGMEKQYQSLNISASPSFVTAQGRENERRGWTKETYDAKNKEPGNRYDWSRRHLNFEIKRGKEMGRINGKPIYDRPTIIPLGTQEKSLKERYEERLKELKFKPWSPDAPNQPNTCVDFVLNGDHDRMTEIAFGKPMDFDWSEDNSSVTLADDPDHLGFKQIETLALEYYEFLCRKFGEEIVLGLECHLDETTPHFHALVVPVAERKPQGRTGGYDLEPDVESDDKERPKHIITRQYERLSEDEKRFYKPAVKKKVPMVSYAHYFGKTKYQAYTSYKHWHTMLYEEVNSKWGLARGEDTSLMTPEERKEHRKKSKRKLEQERLEALKKAEDAEQKAETSTKEYAVIQEKLQQAGRTLSLVEDDIREGRKQVAKMVTQVEIVRKDLNDARQEKDKVQKEKTVLEQRVEELVNAVGDPKEVADMLSFDKMVFAYNPETKGAIIDNLKANGKLHVTIMDVIIAAFVEIDKIKARKIGFFDDPKEVKKKRDADIKSVMTDMQTILRCFASVHKDELTRRSRAIIKQEMRQNAIAIKKIHQYDEMTRRGITIDSYEKAKEKADNYDNISSILEAVWPGLWNAVQVIINPRLDTYVMNDREKETIRKAVGEKPKARLANAEWVLKAADAIRNIAVDTKAEVYQIGAESAVNYLEKMGLNLAEGVAEKVAKVAANTACLFFGCVDAATTISESCGGGCSNNDLPYRKNDEDDLAFARRCHQAAKTMILSSHKRGYHR